MGCSLLSSGNISRWKGINIHNKKAVFKMSCKTFLKTLIRTFFFILFVSQYGTSERLKLLLFSKKLYYKWFFFPLEIVNILLLSAFMSHVSDKIFCDVLSIHFQDIETWHTGPDFHKPEGWLLRPQLQLLLLFTFPHAKWEFAYVVI